MIEPGSVYLDAVQKKEYRLGPNELLVESLASNSRFCARANALAYGTYATRVGAGSTTGYQSW
jgi:hypothetical protein